MTKTNTIKTFGDKTQESRHEEIAQLMRTSPIPDFELPLNVGLYSVPQTLSRVLFLDFLYRNIIEVQGCLFDLGCRWGQTASIFVQLRGIYEPYNRLRKVVAFDTFKGFNEPTVKDGSDMKYHRGQYSVPDGYKDVLEQILSLQEGDSPLSHLKKYEIVNGSVETEMPSYLRHNPETMVALAYFDFDLYSPTKACLQAIADRVTCGTVLAFDELNCHENPGETIAVQEVLGLSRHAIKRYQYNSRASYLVIGGTR